MGDGARKRSRRSRNRRAAEPYANFYANYYGLDEPSTPPTRHRAAASRTGAALLAGLSALMHRKTVVVLTLGLSAVLILAVGVMASATRTGSDPNHVQSLVDTTGSPTEQALLPVAGGTTPAPTSSGAPSLSATSSANPPVISTPGNLPVYQPPPAGPADQPATTQPGAPAPTGQHSSTNPAPQPSTTHHAPPPSTTHTTSSAPPPPPPTSSEPSPTPSPSPTKKCIIPDPFHPGKCILAGP